MTDFVFRVPADRLAEAQHSQRVPTYVYRFDWATPGVDGRLGARHAADIGYVFGGVEASPNTGKDVARLIARMQRTWAAFARTGRPDTPETRWTPFDPGQRSTMLIDDEWREVTGPRELERRCWDSAIR
jgi:para-nitrobenzyl esterase